MADFVCGATKRASPRGVNFGRDCREPTVADLRNVVDATLARRRGTLEILRGIEVGHVFALGTRYSKDMRELPLRPPRRARRSRSRWAATARRHACVAAAIEQNHDTRGIVWRRRWRRSPSRSPRSATTATRRCASRRPAARRARAAGVEVLLDDRGERPGVCSRTSNWSASAPRDGRRAGAKTASSSTRVGAYCSTPVPSEIGRSCGSGSRDTAIGQTGTGAAWRSETCGGDAARGTRGRLACAPRRPTPARRPKRVAPVGRHGTVAGDFRSPRAPTTRTARTSHVDRRDVARLARVPEPPSADSSPPALRGDTRRTRPTRARVIHHEALQEVRGVGGRARAT